MDVQYSLREIAKKLKVSERTVLREIQRGKITPQKVGHKYLISETVLNRYLSQVEPNKDITKSLLNFTYSRKGEMINLLQKMVSLPSVGYKADQEYELAKFIYHTLEANGVRTVLMKEGNAIAVRASYGYADRGILIDCPLDTSPVGDINSWRYPPFGGVVKNGKMYGRGTADCKAGIVAAIYALLSLRETVDEGKIRLELVFDGGEQDGSYKGMEMVIKRGLYADAGIIGYAGDEFELAIGCRGYHRYTFTAQGRSAHTGSRYNSGVNAIEKMTKFIREMYLQKLPESKSKLFPFGQKMTFATIEGGTEINVVPDRCVSRLDFRTTPDFSREYVDNLIEKVLAGLKAKDKNLKIDWKYDLGNEGYVINPQEKIVSLVNESVKEAYGKKPVLVASGPSNVGTLLFKKGIPTLIWGPRGGNVHAYDEYIEIDSIPLTSRIYAQTVLNYFKL